MLQNILVYTCLYLCYYIAFYIGQKIQQKILQNSNEKRIYNKQRMFKALFYPRQIKFYTDNVCASVTNSMSGFTLVTVFIAFLNKVLNQHVYVLKTNGECWRFVQPLCFGMGNFIILSFSCFHPVTWISLFDQVTKMTICQTSLSKTQGQTFPPVF